LAFSVTIFCSGALIAIMILLVRRSKAIGGELGGPKVPKYITAAALFGLWIMYLVLSTLEAYGFISFGKGR
jgi:solute carrier family 8 (sodium/calcium exchanger)